MLGQCGGRLSLFSDVRSNEGERENTGVDLDQRERERERERERRGAPHHNTRGGAIPGAGGGDENRRRARRSRPEHGGDYASHGGDRYCGTPGGSVLVARADESESASAAHVAPSAAAPSCVAESPAATSGGDGGVCHGEERIKWRLFFNLLG